MSNSDVLAQDEQIQGTKPTGNRQSASKITEEQRAKLKVKRFSDYQIGQMTAEQAAQILDPAAGPLVIAPSKANRLTQGELNTLHSLGWKKDDMIGMGAFELRDIIRAKLKKADYDALPAPEDGAREAEHYAPEAIAERQAGRLMATEGFDVRLDDYTQRCIAGNDPLDAEILEVQQVYPNDVIRLVNPDLPPSAGPQFQQVYTKEGKARGAAGLMTQRMPKDIYDEAFRGPNLKRSRELTGALDKTITQAGVAPQSDDPGLKTLEHRTRQSQSTF